MDTAETGIINEIYNLNFTFDETNIDDLFNSLRQHILQEVHNYLLEEYDFGFVMKYRAESYILLFQFNSKKMGGSEMSDQLRTKLLEEFDRIRPLMDVYNKILATYTKTMTESLEKVELYFKEKDFLAIHKNISSIVKEKVSIL